MSVSKRTRYEVLKRDNHTCRYCGTTAQDGPLTVDHVVPVALGGSDTHDNLVAACKDCNAGKASTSPDAALVADVKEDSLRYAELLRGAYAVIVEQLANRDHYIDEFAQHYTYEPLPADWRHSIGRWFEMGVPIEILTDAAHIACTKTQTFRGHGRFTYMCGIVWSQVERATEAVESRRHMVGHFFTEEFIGERESRAWEMGWDTGYLRAEQHAARNDSLSLVVDKIDYAAADAWPA